MTPSTLINRPLHQLRDTLEAATRGALRWFSVERATKTYTVHSMDLSDVSHDVVSAIMQHLDPRDVVRASQCSRAWCRAAEESFEARCKSRRWRLPRRPRGGDASTSAPWRRLFRDNSCRACVNGPGEFRVTHNGVVRVFSLCAPCTSDPGVVATLQEWRLYMDFQSVTGKVLPGMKVKKRKEIVEIPLAR